MKPENQIIRLLLLTCGTNACYHVAKTLKEKFGSRIWIAGTDINKRWMIPTSPYLDAFSQCPLTSDESYYEFIISFCEKEHIDYLLPSFDADQQLFFDGNEDLNALNVKSFGISKSMLHPYSSKKLMNECLLSLRLPIPKTYHKEEVKADKEYFVKPKTGVGSIGARKQKGSTIIEDKDEDLIIEEICHEPEITLECFNYRGHVYAIARERLGVKSGVCTKARIFQDESLRIIAQRFADSKELPYIFNLQFMQNSQGIPVITDVNLRTAGGMSLSYAAGWDEVSALGKIILQEDNVIETVSSVIPEQYVIRAYTDITTKVEKKKIGFDLDGTLLDSRNRHAIVMNDVLQKHHYSLDTTDLVEFKSDGKNNFAWLLSKNISEEEAKKINKEWIELIENEKYLSYDLLYSGIPLMLQRLSENFGIYLITARNNKDGVLAQIKNLRIEQYFNDICVVPSGSESPQLKANYIKEKGISLFVGDTEVDLKAASLAECEFQVCKHGFRSCQFWQQYQVKEFKETNIN